VVDYLLSGPLAQFGRSGLVREFANRLSQQFAVNLNRTIMGGEPGASMESAGEISVISTTLSIIWAGIRSLFGR
jgi:carbon-monoxide dehydrogenase small subunit